MVQSRKLLLVMVILAIQKLVTVVLMCPEFAEAPLVGSITSIGLS
ncbi:hypothetical protein LP7551_03409 [Roseibium album]|nr:hypothetical protein LP7551_03409 [Roseibium album]